MTHSIQLPLLLLFLFFVPNSYAVTLLDFSQYNFGFNNRPFFGAIVKDLMDEFGETVSVSYGKGFEARGNQIVIDEEKMDQLLKETVHSSERESIARFIIAHEFFHIALKHTKTSDRVRGFEDLTIVGTFSEARKQMEQQVDHLAAKYLHKLGLSTAPIQRLFRSHPEMHGGEFYPTAEERVEAVLKAQANGIETTYFDNPAIKCTQVLGKLAPKLH